MGMKGKRMSMDILTNKAVSKPGSGCSICPDEDGTVTIHGTKMNIASVAALHEHLGELIEGKIARTADGWQYTS
jgi:hypothetical protein